MASFADREKRFEAFRIKHPRATFAEFLAYQQLIIIRDGRSTAQLGPRLVGNDDWRNAGKGAFETCRTRCGLKPAGKVVDYGCGTLRVGYHFIEHLEPEHYFGLDVSDELLNVGREMIGHEMLTRKRPLLGVLFDEDVMAKADAFEADIVYSDSVCTHVHPAEASQYFGNLERLSRKPGSIVLFGVAVGDRQVSSRNLTWPLDRYVAALSNLSFAKFYKSSDQIEEGQTVTTGWLEFRRM